MIKCPNCGFSNDDNCTFCAICGSSVTPDNFYVHNTASTDFSVENLTKKLISKDRQENAKTKSFKRLDKATIAKEAAKIEFTNETVKEYKSTSKSNADKNKQATKSTENKSTVLEKSEPKNTTGISGQENKNLSIDNNNHNEIKSENTAVTKENNGKAIPQKPVKKKSDDKANPANEEINTKENKNVESETKTEETQNTKPAINSEEIPSSAKGSTDGELYKLLSKFFFDTKNETYLFKQDDVDENCNLAMISYIPFLFFVPMIIKPCSGYLRYHGIQGLTMFLTFIILEFFNIIMGAICNSVFNEMLGTILTVIITVFINLAVLLLISIGIANAVKGAARELPIIGKYKLLKSYIY